MRRLTVYALACALLLFGLIGGLRSAAPAQVTSQPVHSGSIPAGARSGPVSEGSRNAGSASPPVSGDGTIGGSNAGRLSGRSVRESTTGNLRSGSVSDASVGAVRDRAPAPAQPIFSENFPRFEEGDTDSAAAPVFDLQPLAEELRQLRPLARQAPNDEASTDAPLDEASPEPSNEEVDDPDAVPPLAEDESDPSDPSDPSDDDAEVTADLQTEPTDP